MLQNNLKKYKSIDGFFEKKIPVNETLKLKKIQNKKLTILGKGNSISGLPYNEKSLLIKLNFKDEIILNKKRLEVETNGNIAVYKIHNFLIQHKLYFPSFPSYSYVSLGACVANCVHGNNPKDGVIKKYIKELEIYNPNFGYKILTRNQNKKLFHLTIGGMGMTGIITKVKLKVLNLKSSFIKVDKKIEFTKLIDVYNYLNKSKYIYNQNNIFINYDKKKFIMARVSSGNFSNKKFEEKKIKKKKIFSFRLNIFKVSLFKKIIEKFVLIKETSFGKKILHINDAFHPSNNRLLYFCLLSKKFIEHQAIIPHSNTKKFLKEFEELCKTKSPLITLCHLKIFNGKAKYLEFDGKGLGLSIHIAINKNFNKFYEDFIKLNKKYSCIINIYKNSYMSNKKIKNIYKFKYKNFSKEIKKINNNFIFVNNIFKKDIFYK